ncbi:hypothetical protein TNCV_646131 [Trichonephila clavipes]|nr:hypothetical protein TNCV_646131 [Trichonephila clavipes]
MNVWKKGTQSSSDFEYIAEPSSEPEINDTLTENSSDEEVPANNLLEFLSYSEKDDQETSTRTRMQGLYSEITLFPTQYAML